MVGPLLTAMEAVYGGQTAGVYELTIWTLGATAGIIADVATGASLGAAAWLLGLVGRARWHRFGVALPWGGSSCGYSDGMVRNQSR